MTERQFRTLCGNLALLTAAIVLAIGITSHGLRSWIVIGMGVLLIVVGVKTSPKPGE